MAELFAVLAKPLFLRFDDAAEKNRELAITLATEMLAALPDATVADSLLSVFQEACSLASIYVTLGLSQSVELERLLSLRETSKRSFFCHSDCRSTLSASLKAFGYRWTTGLLALMGGKPSLLLPGTAGTKSALWQGGKQPLSDAEGGFFDEWRIGAAVSLGVACVDLNLLVDLELLKLLERVCLWRVLQYTAFVLVSV